MLVVLAYLLIRRDENLRHAAGLKEQNRLANYNRLLVESTGEGIYGVDLNGNCTFLERSRRATPGIQSRPGHRPAHARSDPPHAPRRHALSLRRLPDLSRLRDPGQGCRVDDELFWRADGGSFPVEYSAFPIKNDLGAVEGVVITFSDTTRRKKDEESIRGQRRALPHAGRQHPAARLDGRREGIDLLVQPALVRLHRHDAGGNARRRLEDRSTPGLRATASSNAST